MKTKAVYDKEGNDISVNPERRLGKKKGQSDKDFDKQYNKELALDPEVNPTPANLARQKVSDLQADRAATKQAVAMIAAAGAILAVKYIAMNQIKKAADASILAKYGPTFFELYKANGN